MQVKLELTIDLDVSRASVSMETIRETAFAHYSHVLRYASTTIGCSVYVNSVGVKILPPQV